MVNKMNCKYNNSLYTVTPEEIVEPVNEFEELITNYEPTSIIKDDYEAYMVHEMSEQEMLDWVEDMQKRYGGE